MAGAGAEDLDFLRAAQEAVKEKNSIEDQIKRLNTEKRKLTRSISSEEKSVSDEIANTIKKRRQQIESTYDDRIDSNLDKKRKVMDKREKKKAQRMHERFQNETRHLRENSEDLNIEMKTMLRKNGVPTFCGKRWYFIMFCPRGLDELGLMLLSFAICFLGVPFLVMELIKKLVLSGKTGINQGAWSVGIFFVVLIILLIIYFSILNSTRLSHGDVIAEARAIMDKLKANKKQANAIRNSIEKDKDESGYDLSAYDEKMMKLNDEADEIGREKQDALRVFEDETKEMITNEIRSRRQPKVDEMKARNSEISASLDELTDALAKSEQVIAEQFAVTLGPDMCRADKIGSLIALIEDGEARSVSDAIAVFKGK